MTAMIFGGANAMDRAFPLVGVGSVDPPCEGVRGEGWSGIVSIVGARGTFGVGRLSRGMAFDDLLRATLLGVSGELSGPADDLRPETLRVRATGGVNVVGVRGPFDVVGDDRLDEVWSFTGEAEVSGSSCHSK